MVTFADVSTFFTSNNSSVELKEKLAEFFDQLAKGKIKLFDRQGLKTKNLFKSKEIGLDAILYYKYDPTTKPLSFQIIYLHFDEDDNGTVEGLYGFLGTFLGLYYKYNGSFEDEMRPEHLKEAVQGALILCHDHEGGLPLICYQPPATPHLNFFFLKHAAQSRFIQRDTAL